MLNPYVMNISVAQEQSQSNLIVERKWSDTYGEHD
ncbi:hypothetical protein KIPB_016501, partial [Kipferlia bialata]|eukprot:g16501.t1